MNRSSTAPIDKDIVLIGGGHAHVIVLRAFGARPVPGARLTLVARDLETPYSGMLPGWVAGLYTREAIHIDLVRLAQACGARLIHAEALRIDSTAKRVELAGRPSIPYDLLSIDVGITPDLSTIPGADEHAMAVKPIGAFIERWTALMRGALSPSGPRRIAAVGGGAAGAELVLAAATRLRAEAGQNGIDPASFSFALYSAGPLVPTLNSGVRHRLIRALKQRGIAVHEQARVAGITADAILLEDGTSEPADAVLVSTHAQPPPVVRDSMLSKGAGGFVAIGPTLQTLDDPAIFAAGDCAAMVASPREKAGVFAVRQGEPLAANLRRRASGDPMRDFRPQREFLTLIGTGDGDAIGGRGRFLAVSGPWVWRWKHRIDTEWMAMMQDTAMLMPAMSGVGPQADTAMRCGGCAAKVGPGPLGRALRRLRLARPGATTLGLDAPEDAAVIRTASGEELLETVDYFRAFVDDPWLFGRIAANHALNDIYAMGGTPTHALALAGIPNAAPDKVEEDLFQLLAGAASVLEAEGVALSGGHSGESETLSLGFAVTGRPGNGPTLRKGGLQPGQKLVLTKPIGTGIVFAAQMRADARAPWVEAALAGMLASNREPARILCEHGATAATDVTGFGLAGHLAEMAQAAGLSVRLDLAAIPLLPGAATLARSGFASSLLPENRVLEERLVPDTPLTPEALALIFDPQTAGGLLAGVPADRAEACVMRLRSAGARDAVIVGEVLPDGQGVPGFIHLRNVAHWPP